MPENASRASTELNVLAFLYALAGALSLLTGAMGWFLMRTYESMLATISVRGGDQVPPEIEWIFLGCGVATIAFGVVSAGLQIAAAIFVRSARRWTFCTTIAAIESLQFPVGTAIGVYSIVVLMKPAVKSLFAGPRTLRAAA